MLHPGIYWTDLWGISLLSRNCHAGQHQNQSISRFGIARRGLWSHTTSTSGVFQQGAHNRARERRAAWSEGDTHTGKPIKGNCLGPPSQKRGKRQSRKIQWPCVGCQKKQKPLVLIYWSELNSCEKAVWDFGQASVNSDQSQSLRTKSLLRGWLYVQSLTLLSLFSCWPYQTELQATSVQRPSWAFHKLAVAEHLAHWMLQVCYFISPRDLFELPSCNPIPQL